MLGDRCERPVLAPCRDQQEKGGMTDSQPAVTPWEQAQPPTEAAIRHLYEREGLRPYSWGNAPGDRYVTHSHSYAKIIYVVSGSITFGLPASGERLALRAGDRLDLPPGVVHDAVVGPEGVICLEAHREVERAV
jgi:quercetin dioxygenase-like cupin family protein